MTCSFSKLRRNRKGIMAKKFEIDKYNLDIECEKICGTIQDVGTVLSAAKGKLATLENELELTKARLRIKVRTNPQIYGLREKPTKDEVDDQVTIMDPYQEAKHECMAQEGLVEQLKSDLSALMVKKSMIGEDISLYIAGYWRVKEVVTRTQEAQREVNKINRGEHNRRVKGERSD